jgi:hypothetical protein
MPGTSSRSIQAPGGTSQTDSMCRVGSCLASCIASTLTPLRGLETLPIHNPNPESHVTITNPLRLRAPETNRTLRQWQLHLQVVSTPQSVVLGIRSIHRFGDSDMTCLVFAMGRLMELYMSNRRPFMSACDLEIVIYATRCTSKALAEALHWQIIEGLEHRFAAKQHLVNSI